MNRHRRLAAWRACRALTSEVYRATENFPADERYGLRAQMRRASVSAPANIAEGYARWVQRELAHFLSNALGSLAEMDSHIDIAAEQGYIPAETRVKLDGLRDRASRLTFALCRRLRP